MVGGELGGSLLGPIVSIMAYLQSFYSYTSQSLRKEGTLRVAAFAHLLNSESLYHRQDSHTVLASVPPNDHHAWRQNHSIYLYITTTKPFTKTGKQNRKKTASQPVVHAVPGRHAQQKFSYAIFFFKHVNTYHFIKMFKHLVMNNGNHGTRHHCDSWLKEKAVVSAWKTLQFCGQFVPFFEPILLSWWGQQERHDLPWPGLRSASCYVTHNVKEK